MQYSSHYDFTVVIYDRRTFLRLATGSYLVEEVKRVDEHNSQINVESNPAFTSSIFSTTAAHFGHWLVQ